MLTGRPNSPDERRNLMQTTPLARYGAPIAIVAGALMIITRLVILFTAPAEIGPLKAYVLNSTHAVNSVVSILAFALLVIALVALYEREARSAGGFGALAFGAAVIGTMFMTGDWWYEAFAVPRLAEVAPDAIDTFVGGRLLIGGLTSFALFSIGWILYGAASRGAAGGALGVSPQGGGNRNPLGAGDQPELALPAHAVVGGAGHPPML